MQQSQPSLPPSLPLQLDDGRRRVLLLFKPHQARQALASFAPFRPNVTLEEGTDSGKESLQLAFLRLGEGGREGGREGGKEGETRFE